MTPINPKELHPSLRHLLNLYGDRDKARNGGQVLQCNCEKTAQDIDVTVGDRGEGEREGDEVDRKNISCDNQVKSTDLPCGGTKQDGSLAQGQGEGEGEGRGDEEGKKEGNTRKETEGQQEGKVKGQEEKKDQVCVGFDFLGAALSDEIACAIADGLMDPTTLVRMRR